MMDNEKYNDIIYKNRPVSLKHKSMSRKERAAQFASFAALNGYDDAVKEEARLVDKKWELDEDKKRELNQKLIYLQNQKNEFPTIRITYFKADTKKEGGRYEVISCRVKKINTYEKNIILQDGKKITFEDIFEIEVL